MANNKPGNKERSIARLPVKYPNCLFVLNISIAVNMLVSMRVLLHGIRDTRWSGGNLKWIGFQSQVRGSCQPVSCDR